jgi:Ca2+-binding RTX toxin-like protein
MNFEIYRWGDLTAAAAVDWNISFITADATDISGPLSGTVTFAPGELYKIVQISLLDDLIIQGDRTFQFALANPSSGSALGADSSVVATITDSELTGTSGDDTFYVPHMMSATVKGLGGFDTVYVQNDTGAPRDISVSLVFYLFSPDVRYYGLKASGLNATNDFLLVRHDIEKIVIDGSAFADRLVTYQAPGNTNVTFVLNGGAGDDLLGGGAARDTFFFGAGVANGNDTITDYLPGFDTLDFQNATSISYASNLDLDGNGISNDTRVTYTSVGGGGTINLQNVLVGSAGNNTITGTGGKETLDGRGGSYSMAGGLRNDKYIVDDAGDTVIEQHDPNQTGFFDSQDIVYALVQYYALPAEVERLEFIGVGDFVGVGNATNNYIAGGDGNDTLDDGGSGSNPLYNDRLEGGAGNDTYIVRSINTVLQEQAGEGVDTVQSSVTYSIAAFANLENVTLTGGSAINATGNAGANTLIGNAAANTLDGGTGADSMAGGLGDDTYFVDNASDVVLEDPGGGNDAVRVSLSTYVIPNNIEGIIYTGTDTFTIQAGSTAIALTGGANGDTLIGSAAGGALNGGDGADVLWFYGATTLSGGTGFDYAIQLDGAGQTRSIGAAGIEVYVGNNGNDTIDSAGATVTTIIYGGAGGDGITQSAIGGYAFGQDGNDTLTGGDGQDIFLGGAGFDTILGNGGNDVLYMTAATASLSMAARASITPSSIPQRP